MSDIQQAVEAHDLVLGHDGSSEAHLRAARWHVEQAVASAEEAGADGEAVVVRILAELRSS